MHKHRDTLADIPVDEPVFFTIRDPILRFVSAFNARQRGGAPTFDNPPKPREARQFVRFPTPNDLAEALAAPDRKKRKAARRAMKTIRHIKKGLFNFVGMREIKRHQVIWVGDQQTLEADFNRLKEILELPPEVTLPKNDLKANRAPANASTELSDTARRNLEEYFRRDIVLYNKLRTQFVLGSRTDPP